jgi:hypothetical protein
VTASAVLLLALTGQEGPALVESPRIVRKFPAEEAQQGVAVDQDFVYVIGNRVIGKYKRETGEKVARYESPAGGPLIHMNGGIVIGGKLYCSHSNFSGVPMQSSIEVFDPKTLKHIGSQSFGIDAGSLVWMDQHRGRWFVCFGHYNARGGEPGRSNAYSVLTVMDKQYRRMGGYAFPKTLVDRWDGMTASGGVFAKDGTLYVTGHHAPEIYHLRLPKMGSELELIRILKTPVEGQGIALDRATGELFQMQRKEKMIYVLDLY